MHKQCLPSLHHERNVKASHSYVQSIVYNFNVHSEHTILYLRATDSYRQLNSLIHQVVSTKMCNTTAPYSENQCFPWQTGRSLRRIFKIYGHFQISLSCVCVVMRTDFTPWLILLLMCSTPHFEKHCCCTDTTTALPTALMAPYFKNHCYSLKNQ